MDRRDFIKSSTAASIAASLNTKISRASDQPIPRRTLGRTGEKVSMVGIGGYHLGAPSVDEQEAIRIVRAALDNGINFLDNCWDYNGGVSEERMGKALRDGYRQKAFLMTKIDGRTKAAAEQQLNQSLQRLQTDHIDLLQFHEVIRDTDPERIFAAGGGMEAVVAAKKAGKVRYIGFTGHKSPTSVVITGCDSMQILQQALDTARSFKPMSKDEVAALLAKTSAAATKGEFEQYKTTHNFDGTYQNPQWLG